MANEATRQKVIQMDNLGSGRSVVRAGNGCWRAPATAGGRLDATISGRGGRGRTFGRGLARGGGPIAGWSTAVVKRKAVTTTLRFILTGLGNIGRTFLEVPLARRDRLRERYDLVLVPVGVADASGAAADPAGLDVAAVVALKRQGRSVGELPGVGRPGQSALELLGGRRRISCSRRRRPIRSAGSRGWTSCARRCAAGRMRCWPARGRWWSRSRSWRGSATCPKEQVQGGRACASRGRSAGPCRASTSGGATWPAGRSRGSRRC
jgi:hypothetical protein